MLELMKLLKSLTAKGFATKAEKTKVKEAVEALETDEKEVVADQVSAVESLPETDPATTESADELAKSIVDQVTAKTAAEISKAKSAIETDLAAWKAKQEAAAKAGAGVYAPGVAEKRAKLNNAIKGMMNGIVYGDDAAKKELTTGNPGQYIVDRELSAEIRHLMTEYGVARREMFTVVLTKNEYDANALTTDVSVGWVSEAGVIGTTSIEVAQTGMKLKKLAAIASMTRELLQEQEIDLFAFIGSRVAEKMARAEDLAFFTGTGTGDTANGEFDGLLHLSTVTDVVVTDKGGTTGGDAINDIGVNDIYAMIDALPQGAHANAKFYANRTILSVLRQLKDESGRYLYQNPLEVSGVPSLAGYPLVLSEVFPTASGASDPDTSFMLFGDLRKAAILGYNGTIEADRFNAGVIRNVAGNADVNLITTDREAIRWVSRVGYMTVLPSAVVRLTTASTS